ncbi:MarR family winged helix-turn-helix transcriptional regulator [Bailinhaonella thermotolerans]|uniref:MarR family transcriptional regulator n=1 Tax=Bailinhaonella thermotolerans TaxID=1070861 RepID=A0A3A4BN71_9ACTN|nr:MarR family transcriptional regulator [Bailinhaonella thermotolerans]RJL32514.1 MarR family transcriptional regulator [Bailinhaonella thermotolerans]
MSSSSRPLTTRELRAWLGFVRAGHLLDHELERQIKRDGDISHAEYEVLVHLDWAQDHRLRMAELASRVAISKSRLTYQVTQLERAGLVVRTSCPTDGRAVWAQLTDAGAALLARVRPGHREAVRENFIDLLTPEELDVLADAMSRVVARLSPTLAGLLPAADDKPGGRE